MKQVKNLRKLTLITLLSSWIFNHTWAADKVEPKLLKSWSIRPFEAYNNSRIESWAELSFVVSTAGEVEDVVILSHSQVKFDKQEFIERIKMWEFAPATIDSKPIASTWYQVIQERKMFNGVDNGTIKIGFLNTANEVRDAFSKRDYSRAQQQFDVLDKYTKNIAEQALNHWLKAQYFYQMKAWNEYGEQLTSAFMLQNLLPSKYRIEMLQNTLHWYMYNQDYLSASLVIKAFESLGDVNMGDEVITTAMAQLIQDLDNNPVLSHDYIFAAEQPKLIGVSRYQVEVKSQKPLAKVQLRCKYGVIDIPQGRENLYSITQTDINERCAILIESDTEQKVEINQTGKAVQL